MLNEEEAVHYHPTSQLAHCNSQAKVKVTLKDDPRAMTQNILPRENYCFCQLIPNNFSTKYFYHTGIVKYCLLSVVVVNSSVTTTTTTLAAVGASLQHHHALNKGHKDKT